MKRAFVNALGLGLTWAAWLWLASRQLAHLTDLFIAIAGTLAVVPLVLAGRWLLDQQPSLEKAEWVTTGVHYLVALFLGSAIISAVKFGLGASTRLAEFLPSWLAPLLPWLGLGVMLISGLFLLLVVFNLAIKGMGAPFAIALTRVVATDWLYAWTRNPMVLSALAFLVGLGLWLRSGLFLVWVLAVFSPAILVFLKVYEERELEIRFGKAYLDYKAKTPLMIPRKPGE